MTSDPSNEARPQPLRLQGRADRRGASVRTDGRGAGVEGRRQVRRLALCRYRAVRLSYRPSSMQSRRFRCRYRARGWPAPHHLLDQLADGDIDGAAGSGIPRLHHAAACADEAGRQQGRAARRHQIRSLHRGRRGGGAGRDLHHRTAGARARHRRVRRRACSWSALPRCSAGRSAASCGATGRRAIRSIICRRRCCRRSPCSQSSAMKRDFASGRRTPSCAVAGLTDARGGPWRIDIIDCRMRPKSPRSMQGI